MGKKRKQDDTEAVEQEVDTSKPTAIFQPKGGRAWTLSIALPGSIVANAQSRELQAVLAGQIARALAVFCVDEVVIFDDGNFKLPPTKPNGNRDDGRQGYTGFTDPNYFLAHVLSYLECPPNLRRPLFPMHPDLQHTGMMPSLDMAHHLKKTEWCQYREGVTAEHNEALALKRSGNLKDVDVTVVNTGLEHKVYVEGEVLPHSRVTVKFDSEHSSSFGGDGPRKAIAVAPSEPRETKGFHWGYAVRSATSLSAVLTECPFDCGYDLTFGTSERGVPIAQLQSEEERLKLPSFNHMMIVFGGVAGLEVAVRYDQELQKLGLEGPERLFDHWINLVPGQGSRTIRTEEAVWLGLMALKDIAETKGRS